jgi:hypothetical protein
MPPIRSKCPRAISSSSAAMTSSIGMRSQRAGQRPGRRRKIGSVGVVSAARAMDFPPATGWLDD